MRATRQLVARLRASRPPVARLRATRGRVTHRIATHHIATHRMATGVQAARVLMARVRATPSLADRKRPARGAATRPLADLVRATRGAATRLLAVRRLAVRLVGARGDGRQWGADRHQNPMPAVPLQVGDGVIVLGRAAVAVTAAAWLAFVVLIAGGQLLGTGPGRPGLLSIVVFAVIVTLLACSAIAYMVARLGFYARAGSHRRVARATIDAFYATRRPKLTVLVPSYQEDARVVRLTLLSAALQEYPDLRVVLLIDDPPDPHYARPDELLRAARRLPAEVASLLAPIAARFTAAWERFGANLEPGRPVHAGEIEQLADQYDHAVTWLRGLRNGYPVCDHAAAFLATHVVGRLAEDLSVTSAALRNAVRDRRRHLTAGGLDDLYRRLAWTFAADLTHFERKRYVSLSHEPNKAMNLNSYIGLMGGTYRDELTPAGRVLRPLAPDADPVVNYPDLAVADLDLVVDDPDYVLTLDADSVILPEYCLRLVHLLEQPQHAAVAVAQTPYSAFPGAATRLERIAGATTDLQHIVHQGMTFHGATFWVGANALLRKRALDELCEVDYAGEWPIRRYVRDRTVIEDTETTVELGIHGWGLLSYPERLSYSATPPDFGALCIQRHRWSNGGLLIAPGLWTYRRGRRARGGRLRIGELCLQINYLASIAWSSVALLILLSVSFNNRLLNPLVLAMAAPYFATMAFDLHYCGYKALDVVRIYAFNLLLLPVNLAGAGSSLVQALTGAKGRFRRTPKVRWRTTPAFAYLVLPYALVALSLYTLRRSADHGEWGDAVFAGANAVLCAYAIVAFIGLRESLVDTWANVLSWVQTPAIASRTRSLRRTRPPIVVDPRMLGDWERVLYFGSAEEAFAPDAVGVHDGRGAARPPTPVPPATPPRATPPPAAPATPFPRSRRRARVPLADGALPSLAPATFAPSTTPSMPWTGVPRGGDGS